MFKDMKCRESIISNSYLKPSVPKDGVITNSIAEAS